MNKDAFRTNLAKLGALPAAHEDPSPDSTARALLLSMEAKGAAFSVEDGDVTWIGPAETVTPDTVAAVRLHKPALLRLLAPGREPITGALLANRMMAFFDKPFGVPLRFCTCLGRGCAMHDATLPDQGLRPRACTCNGRGCEVHDAHKLPAPAPLPPPRAEWGPVEGPVFPEDGPPSAGVIDGLLGIVKQLREAEAGRHYLITDEYGKVTGGLRQPSTYPEWLSAFWTEKTRARADRLIRVINAGVAGTVLKDSDLDLWRRLVKMADYEENNGYDAPGLDPPEPTA